MTAVYSNYFLILTSVTSLFGIIGSSMVASVGNSIVTENEEKNYRDMRRFNFMYMLLAGWAVICMLCLYQPFVRLWVGPDLMLGMPEVVALCLYFYVLKMGDLRWIYFEGAGLWWKARYIVIAEIIANIVLNLLLAKYWGVLGIILATLISLFFINYIGEAWILFKEYFKDEKLSEFFCDQALYLGVTVMIAFACLWGCEGINCFVSSLVSGATNVGQAKLFEMAGLVSSLLLCTLVTIGGYFLVYHRTARYGDAKEWIVSRYRGIKREE